MINFPNIDPVILYIGPLAIRWYSVAYIVGLLGGYFYFIWVNKKFKIFHINKDQVDSLLTYVVLGIILGGRIGYVLLYQPSMFVNDPINVLNTLQGGMSFHGGLAGFCLSIFIFCRKNKVNYISLLDISSCLASIPIFLGRIANFINAELYGRVTDVSWGIIFPGGGILPRHPSQLYEAVTEGLLLLALQNFWLFKKKFKYPGFMSASFAIFYGVSRFIIEFFREADAHIGLFFSFFTIGQFYCIIMILIGLYIAYITKKSKYL